MTRIKARIKILTPLGTIFSKGDEIKSDDYVEYVKEVTSLIVDSRDGAASFEDTDGNIVFIMPEILKNSVVIVEKIGLGSPSGWKYENFI